MRPFFSSRHIVSGSLTIGAGSVVHTATPLKMRVFRIALVLILGLVIGRECAAQTAASAGSQAEQAQGAYRAGATAATNNDFKTAEAEFEKVTRLLPQVEEGHSALGAVLIRMGKFSQAIKELETAVALKPGDLSAQTNLAWAYEQMGAYPKAIAIFEKAEVEARQTPGSSGVLPAETLEAYARSLAATGQVPLAVSKMNAALAESPQNAELHDALGSLYAQQRSWSSAVGEFQKAVQISPRLAVAHLHLGVALLEQQHAAPAILELTEACQLAPENAVAATELGKAYAATNEDDKAIAAFQRAIRLDSRSMEAKYQ